MTSKETRDKILEGTQHAIDRLLGKKSKEDGDVVISENGKVVKVKASEILENRKPLGSWKELLYFPLSF